MCAHVFARSIGSCQEEVGQGDWVDLLLKFLFSTCAVLFNLENHPVSVLMWFLSLFFFRVPELGGWWENSLTIMEAADQNLQLCVFSNACLLYFALAHCISLWGLWSGWPGSRSAYVKMVVPQDRDVFRSWVHVVVYLDLTKPSKWFVVCCCNGWACRKSS